MLRCSLMLIICLLLAGCAAADLSPAVSDTATSPATVHEQFVQALQRNDRQAVLALVGDIQFKEGLVDTWLVDATALQRPSHFIGKFIEVQLLPPTEQGAGQTAISLWHYETSVSCYRATLAQTDDIWQVTTWTRMGLGTCPKS